MLILPKVPPGYPGGNQRKDNRPRLENGETDRRPEWKLSSEEREILNSMATIISLKKILNASLSLTSISNLGVEVVFESLPGKYVFALLKIGISFSIYLFS